MDDIIRKYGYCGTPKAMEEYGTEEDLQEFAHATAPLLHGSSEARFTIRYAPLSPSKEEIEAVLKDGVLTISFAKVKQDTALSTLPLAVIRAM